MIIGGGIVVIVLGQISISEYGELNRIISSGIQAVIAVILVIIWIIILSKIKNLIFRKQINS